MQSERPATRPAPIPPSSRYTRPRSRRSTIDPSWLVVGTTRAVSVPERTAGKNIRMRFNWRLRPFGKPGRPSGTGSDSRRSRHSAEVRWHACSDQQADGWDQTPGAEEAGRDPWSSPPRPVAFARRWTRSFWREAGRNSSGAGPGSGARRRAAVSPLDPRALAGGPGTQERATGINRTVSELLSPEVTKHTAKPVPLSCSASLEDPPRAPSVLMPYRWRSPSSTPGPASDRRSEHRGSARSGSVLCGRRSPCRWRISRQVRRAKNRLGHAGGSFTGRHRRRTGDRLPQAHHPAASNSRLDAVRTAWPQPPDLSTGHVFRQFARVLDQPVSPSGPPPRLCVSVASPPLRCADRQEFLFRGTAPPVTGLSVTPG